MKTNDNTKKTAESQLTIVIKGKAYERLKGIAMALNEYAPDDGPFTPQSVWDDFFNDQIEQLESTDKDHVSGCPAVDEIVDLIATAVTDSDSQEKKIAKILKKYVK